jgi:hypothetical protein
MSETNLPTLSKKKKVNGAKKGKQFERDVANALGHIFPEAQRLLEYQASNVIGVDIEGTYPFLIQCKNHQNYCSIGTINEVKIQSPHDIPVLITKGIRMEAMAVLPFEKFVTLLEVVYGLRPRFQQASTDRHEQTKLIKDADWETVESPYKSLPLHEEDKASIDAVGNALSDFL